MNIPLEKEIIFSCLPVWENINWQAMQIVLCLICDPQNPSLASEKGFTKERNLQCISVFVPEFILSICISPEPLIQVCT